jgi:hypothetical protein
MKPMKCWVVTCVDGKTPIPSYTGKTRKEAIAASMRDDTHSWSFWRKAGCRCVRAEITVKESTK